MFIRHRQPSIACEINAPRVRRRKGSGGHHQYPHGGGLSPPKPVLGAVGRERRLRVSASLPFSSYNGKIVKSILIISPDPPVVRFKVGDFIYHKISRENGRIVRLADLASYGLCYIVVVLLDPTIWRTPATEALWHPSEVEQSHILP
jgi:hypothetical protein